MGDRWMEERMSAWESQGEKERQTEWEMLSMKSVTLSDSFTLSFHHNKTHTCANVFWKSNTENFFHRQGAKCWFRSRCPIWTCSMCHFHTEKLVLEKKIGCPMAPKTCWSPTFQNNNNNSKLDISHYNQRNYLHWKTKPDVTMLNSSR